MPPADQPLIVGAGPVGLAAALFLARLGHKTRVVEMRDRPAEQSKALAVSPRSLDLLEPTGVTERMLALGMPIRGVSIHRGGRIVGENSFAGIHPRYPFMLALSQATSERLLAEALTAAGGRVERGVKLAACRHIADSVEATLAPTVGGPHEIVACPWLLAADGAHSTVRHQFAIAFDGSSFAHAWHLADVPLRTALAEDQGHVFFLDDGAFLFLIRVVGDADHAPAEGPLWRVIGNCPEPLAQLVQAEPAGPPAWESEFHVAHRLAATFSAGHAYLAGDAAHVHSPVGARGMNLGLEDAWVFATLAGAGRLAEYAPLRQAVDARVVRQVRRFSEFVSGETAWFRFLRAAVLPVATRIPFVRAQMARTITGLDHELPKAAPERGSC